MNARSMSTFSRASPSSVWREGRLGEEDVGKGEEGGGEGEERGGGGGGGGGEGEESRGRGRSGREERKEEEGMWEKREEEGGKEQIRKVGVVLYTCVDQENRLRQTDRQTDRGDIKLPTTVTVVAIMLTDPAQQVLVEGVLRRL